MKTRQFYSFVAVLLSVSSFALGQLAPATPSARRPEWWAAKVSGPNLTLQQFDTTANRRILVLKNRVGTEVFGVDINGNVYASGTLSPVGTLSVSSGGTGRVTFTANALVMGNGTAALQSLTPGAVATVLTSNGTTPVWTGIGGDITGPISSAVVTKIRGKNVPVPTSTEDGKYLRYDNGTGAYVWDTPVNSGGTVTGTGTTATLPKWTSSSALGNSILSESGSIVTATGSVIQTTPVTNQSVFGTGFIPLPDIANILWRADKRMTVTSSGLSGSTSLLFDNDYDATTVSTPISSTSTLTVDMSPELGSSGIVYSEGYLYAHYYFTNVPASVTARVQNQSGTWFSCTGAVNVSNNPLYAIWRLTVPATNFIVKLELTTNSGPSVASLLTEFEYMPMRPSGLRGPVFNRSVANTIYTNTSWSDTAGTTQTTILPSGRIIVKGTTDDGSTALQVTGTVKATTLRTTGVVSATSLATDSSGNIIAGSGGGGGLTNQFSQTASSTLANTTTETSLFGTGTGTLTLPVNTLAAGKQVRFTLKGVAGNGGTGGNLTIRFKIVGTTQATATWTLPTSASDNLFDLDFLLTCRTAGTGGTVIGQGKATRVSASSSSIVPLTMTATTTVDTTITRTVDVTGQWSSADPGETITITNAAVEVF